MEIKIKKKKPMPWYQKITYIMCFILLLAAFIYLGTRNYEVPRNKKNDQINFANEYHISINNVYRYKTSNEILSIFQNGNGIIFFGYPENEWCEVYAEILNQVAINNEIKEIAYYNLKTARSTNNNNYTKIKKYLNEYIYRLDNGTTNIYAPSLAIIKNGKIIGFDNETSIIQGNITKEEYWTNSKKVELADKLNIMIENFIGDYK